MVRKCKAVLYTALYFFAVSHYIYNLNLQKRGKDNARRIAKTSKTFESLTRHFIHGNSGTFGDTPQ